MKYIANPVEVTAYQIREVIGSHSPNASQGLTSYDLVIGPADNSSPDQNVTATPEMCSRMVPKVGDYWVIQEDGYIYLNPKEVFERKYRPQNAEAAA
jgi:hypothetical protein